MAVEAVATCNLACIFYQSFVFLANAQFLMKMQGVPKSLPNKIKFYKILEILATKKWPPILMHVSQRSNWGVETRGFLMHDLPRLKTFDAVSHSKYNDIIIVELAHHR